jgi:hypothetical protein
LALLLDRPRSADALTESFSVSLSFSFASSILFAVPLLAGTRKSILSKVPAATHDTYLFLNSSGTSIEGLRILAATFGFWSSCVLEGRETYGRVDLHSKM